MQIYEVVKGDLKSVFLGFNISYFAYGQTGSGFSRIIQKLIFHFRKDLHNVWS